MRVNVRFEGGRELSAALRTLGAESTVAGRRALRATAKELQAELVAAAPRNPAGATEKSRRAKDGTISRYSYGQLFQNIRVREARALKDRTIVMTVTTGRAFWGSFLEFGTSKMRARPWFRPVWDRMQNRLIAALGERLGVQIERAARRVARGGAPARNSGANRNVLPNGRNG